MLGTTPRPLRTTNTKGNEVSKRAFTQVLLSSVNETAGVLESFFPASYFLSSLVLDSV